MDGEDISALAGLHRRSPLLAATMTLAMASLAGIPPLAGFFGKFLLLKAVIEQGPAHPGYYCLAFTALAGVVISLYYYFGVVRAMYWSERRHRICRPSKSPGPFASPSTAASPGCSTSACSPNALVELTTQAVKVLR